MSVPSNLIPTRITQLPVAPTADENSLMMIVYQGNNYQIRVGDLLSVAGVPTTRQVIAGTGMTGGGQLSSNVTLSIAPGGVGSTELASSGVTPGSYGTATDIPVFTVDATGRVMSATTVPATFSGYVPDSRQVNTGAGLSGGGALTSNLTITVNLSSATPLAGFQSGSAGVSTDISRADHKHPAVNLGVDDEVDGILGLGNGGTARSIVADAGAIIWSGADGLYVGPVGLAGQVLVSSGTSAPTWGSALTISDQAANLVYAGPAAGAAAPTGFRTLVAADLPNSGASAGTYGAAATVPVFTVNAKGQITAVTNTTIAISTSQITSGTLGVDRGGTGASSLTANGILYGNGTSAVGVSSAGVTGEVLVGNTGSAPTWGALSSNAVTSFSGGTTGLTPSSATQGVVTLAGTLAVANGGTGLTTTPANGQIDIGNGTGFSRATLTAGSGVTITDGAGSVTINATGLGGTVTSVDVSGGTTGLTTSGGPITTSGTITLAGTLAAANGGTGQSSYTIGDLLYASGATALSKLADIATGNALISGGVATAPSWGKIGLTTHVSGTLPVTNGGTGTATAFTAGSVVFAGASGVYAQDNASLFFDDTNNRLGIGTVSPDASLTVNTIASFGAGAAALPSIAAKGDLDTGVWFPAANTIAASTGGSERLRIDTSGNVGIGTSSPAYKLDINSITGWGANQTAPIANIVGANAPTNGGGNLRVLSNTSATADAGGSLVLGGYYTAQTNSIDYAEISGRKQTGQTTGGYLALSTRADLGNETERLRIDSSGNVGIGTSSPSSKLEVSGQINGSPIYIKSGGSTSTLFYDTALLLSQSGTGERLRIDSSGNVGIGTSSPAGKVSTERASGSAGWAYHVKTTGISNDSGIYMTASNNFEMVLRDSSTNLSTITNNGNNLVLSTGGTERARIDSSGNVGIGTSAPSQKLEVYAAANSLQIESVVRNDQAGTGVAAIGFNVSSSASAETTSTKAGIGLVRSAPFGVGPLCFYNNNSGAAGNFTTADEKMRIDSSGNVGIGTSSPGEKLVVSGSNVVVRSKASSGFAGFVVDGATGGQAHHFFNVNSVETARLTSDAGNFLSFSTGSSATERARIDSSGNLSVGSTAADGRFNVSWSPNAQQGIATRSTSESYSGAAILFLNSTGGQAGNIFQATSSVSYNTSSDYRMKENVAPLNSGLATIAALKPISYDWIIDKSKGEGFIAHELAEHIPLAVTGEKDAINKDGSINSQSVDYSKIVVHLVVAIQELSAKVAVLEGKQ